MISDAVGRPMEILLVEDDLEDAGLTIEALREGDVACRVSLVRDGEEAMDFVHRRGKYGRAPRPDLILLDLHLPKKDGREVLAEVKADPELERVPVVVLTSSSTHREVLKSLELSSLLDLNLRLGEGTGAALGISLVEAAVRLLRGMATFREAGVSGALE